MGLGDCRIGGWFWRCALRLLRPSSRRLRLFFCSFVGAGIFGRLLGWRGFSDRYDGCLLFVDLAQRNGPSWWFVVTAAGRFMKAEGLESSGEGEKEECRRDEDANIEVDQAHVFEKSMRRRHYSFVHNKMKCDKFSPISRARISLGRLLCA